MNVVVYMPGWIGDAVMATPCLRALRRQFADAHLVGVGKPYVAGVLEGGDWFDQWINVPTHHWDGGVCSLAGQLRSEPRDLAVLLPNSFRSALAVWLGGCRRRVGYARYGRSFLLTDTLAPLRGAQGRLTPSPILEAYNRLAEAVGCSPPGHQLELFTTPANRLATDRVWERAGLNAFREVICLNSGGAFGLAKHWPIDYFATLARDLAVERGCGVLILCGPAERDLSRRLAAMARHPAVQSLADHATPSWSEGPALSLGLSKGCVQRSSLLVTTDSGPRHFAHAFNRPVVTLFGPTHIAWTETNHLRAVHLQKKVACGPCQKRVCPLDHRCMTQLTPLEVFREVVTLLEHGERAAA
jgi:heptosyltransferase II